jgi:hypothetical protein
VRHKSSPDNLHYRKASNEIQVEIVSGYAVKTNPLARGTLRVSKGNDRELRRIVWVTGRSTCDPFTQDDAGGTPAS